MNKKIFIDIDLCVGCGTCVVACMDQNDLFPEKGDVPFRRIYQLEEGSYPHSRIRYVSLGCMHCENAPCALVCPSGAIYKSGSSIQADRERCVGCRRCSGACPYSVPLFDSQDKMSKCNLCETRTENGLKPVCVKSCPTGALRFTEPDGAGEQSEMLDIIQTCTEAVNG